MSRQEKKLCKSYRDGKCKYDQDCLHNHPTDFTVLAKSGKKLRSKEVKTKGEGSKELSNTVPEEIVDVSDNENDSEKNKDDCKNEIMSETEGAEKEIRATIARALDKSRSSSDVNYLTHLLRDRVLTSFLIENFKDILNIIVKSLRGGKEADIVSGASLSTVVIISLATFKESEQVYKSIHPILTKIICDPSTSPISKLECCKTLATSCFLTCNDVSELKHVCKPLQSLYAQSLPDEYGKYPSHKLDTYRSFMAAIRGHCLLMTIMPPLYVYETANDLIEIMFTLLKCSCLGIRLTAGESIALIYEIAREHDEDYSWSKGNLLSKELKKLATDSQKFRAKKDRKEQRCTFRELIRSIEERFISEDKIEIGPMLQRQDFNLNTWKLKCQYQALCHSLASGINTHLTFNVGLRNIYELGPPPEKLDRKSRVKMRRHDKQQEERLRPSSKEEVLRFKKLYNKKPSPISFTNAEE